MHIATNSSKFDISKEIETAKVAKSINAISKAGKLIKRRIAPINPAINNVMAIIKIDIINSFSFFIWFPSYILFFPVE